MEFMSWIHTWLASSPNTHNPTLSSTNLVIKNLHESLSQSTSTSTNTSQSRGFEISHEYNLKGLVQLVNRLAGNKDTHSTVCSCTLCGREQEGLVRYTTIPSVVTHSLVFSHTTVTSAHPTAEASSGDTKYWMYQIPKGYNLGGLVEKNDRLAGEEDKGYSVVHSGTYVGKEGKEIVAIKVPNSVGRDHSQDGRKHASYRRLMREFWAGLAFNAHENVVKVLGIVPQLGTHGALVMPLYPENLDQYIKDCKQARGQRSVRQRYQLWLGAVCGVEHIHSLGFVHGDLKPLNILIDKDGNAKVGDLGLLHFSGSPQIPGGDNQAPPVREVAALLNTTTQHEGTARYLAPELTIDSGRVGEPKPPTTEKSDVYALGCIGVESMLFIMPFEGYENRRGAIYDFLRYDTLKPFERPKPVGGTDPEMQRGISRFWDIIEECTSRDSTRRPSALGLLKMLQDDEELIIAAIEMQEELDVQK